MAFIEIDGRTVASGLGILDRGHIGLYAIYGCQLPSQNFARAICSAILSEAEKRGPDMPTFRWFRAMWEPNIYMRLWDTRSFIPTGSDPNN